MIVAILDDSSWQAYVGGGLYLFFAYIFVYSEWRLGTDALRYINSNYYSDPYLYPSMLYLFGIMDHENKVESYDFAYEKKEDEEAENIDEEDESDVEDQDIDQEIEEFEDGDFDEDALFALTL